MAEKSSRKTDSPRKRMREVLHRAPKLPPLSFDRTGEPEEYWILEAKAALTIQDMREFRSADGSIIQLPDDFVDYSTRAVRKLFEHFKLNPDQPLHWRWLVNLFAYIEFWEGPKKKRGRPKEWTDARDKELAAALKTLPSQSNAGAARLLLKDKKITVHKGVGTKSGSSLRKRIAKVKANNLLGE
jgi:hypothetical protein